MVCAVPVTMPRISCRNTYEQVLRRPRFLRRDQDLAYLLCVLGNAWIRSMRKPRPIAPAPQPEEIESVPDVRVDPVGEALEARAVYDALGSLTPRLREAVVAVDVLGLSYKEAARAPGSTEGTIMSRLYRGRGQIAELLKAHS
jgi:RNA polymerase sigma-70 factor, ECF subfamily